MCIIYIERERGSSYMFRSLLYTQVTTSRRTSE